MTTQGFKLQTLGHASIALYREGEAPLLLTDPVARRLGLLAQLVAAELPRRGRRSHWLADAANVYITHEHPDHFHMPSIRRLGNAARRYLFPALTETRLSRLHDEIERLSRRYRCRRCQWLVAFRRGRLDPVVAAVERRQLCC
jgi:glyoxylase-like metal-dependent hydrolase (beta-lactamase superfamily II)